MTDIGLFFAFTAGILSFFSPCVFPLLPAYITHLTGGKIEGSKVAVDRATLFTRSFGFIVGFSLIFIVMGASASFLGQVFANYRTIVMQIAGLLIIIFGLQMAGLLNIKFLMMEKKSIPIRNRKALSVLYSLEWRSRADGHLVSDLHSPPSCF